MTTLNNEQLNQVELLYKHYKKTDLTRSEINDFIKIGNIKNPSWLKQDQFKVARGVYALPIDGDISLLTLMKKYNHNYLNLKRQLMLILLIRQLMLFQV